MHLLLLPLLVLVLQALWAGPLAPRLERPGSVRVLDRAGQTLADVRDERLELSVPVRLAELSPWVEPALLAAEDRRFYSHPGIDPLAMLRAAGQALASGRIVSGASTITQQLARTVFDRPRTLAGKWRELVLSVRLEAELDKATILEAYLDRVSFGPRVRGIGAASLYYFDKPALALSLAEAATLVSIVQGPSRLDPERHAARLERRRNRVLARMLELGLAEPEPVELAQRAPLALHRGHVLPGAFHFVRAAVSGKLGAPPRASGASRTFLSTSIDGGLQREVESLVRSFDARFAEHRASAAAVVVMENRSAAVRAYVGAPDHRASADLGQNDGVLALRQPGSTLKPFVYALAMEDLGLSAASVLPDLPRRFSSLEGQFLPNNYDRRFHGPVRLGQALASSLNVPAVTLAERIGPERVVAVLRDLGFSHLNQPAAHYGPAIALGVAEVQLIELAGAYSALSRGGTYLPPRFFETDPVASPRRVLPAALTRQIVAILTDPRERAATFGRDGALELDVPVAVKTGTSKGNRDNWVVGFTPELTVAVWVGNFDGSPMLRSSGATGAGPLFHEVMGAALRRNPVLGRPPLGVEPTAASDASVVEVCALSGLLAGPACPHRLQLEAPSRQAPRETCDWHRCAPSAPDEDEEGWSGCSSIEVIPERYAAWARDSGRLSHARRASSQGPAARSSASQPPAGGRPGARAPVVVFPRAEQRFVLDQHVSGEQQQIVLVAAPGAPVWAGAHERGSRLVFEVDGARVCEVGAPFECPWSLARGRHALAVRAGADRGTAGAEPVATLEFSVE